MKRPGFFARQFFDHGMPAGGDPHLAVGGETRARIAVLRRHLRQRGGDIQFRDRRRRGANSLRMIGRFLADFGEDALLDFENLLFRREHLALVFLQLRRGEALGVHQRLFALVIGRREVHDSPSRSRCNNRKRC